MEFRPPKITGSLVDKLRAMDISRSRIRLKGLSPLAERFSASVVGLISQLPAT
ncbi:putative calcium uniporter protein [Sesbania bispinosa]|nr:putative calcium uniporter protein [Sesbania bispinosa]